MLSIRDLPNIVEDAINPMPAPYDKRMILESFRYKGFVYCNLKRNQLESNGDKLIFNGNTVDKLQLIYDQRQDAQGKAYLYIRYENHEEDIYLIKQNKFVSLLDCFRILNAKIEYIHDRLHIHSSPWTIYSQQDYYKPHIKIAYDKLHKLIIKEILRIIDNHPMQAINIIDAGCGSGLFLRALEQELLARNNLTTRLLGFDFNRRNIDDCTRNYQGRCHFKEGNLLNFDEVLNAAEANHYLYSQQGVITIVVLSGSLTRLVLNLTEGLQSLGAITRTKKVNYLIGGGVGEPLITPYLAKQFGYQLIREKFETMKFFHYERMTEKQFFAYKLEKMQRKNVLDLSFCEDTAIIHQLRDYITDKTIIDISYCNYTLGLESVLFDIVKQHPQVRLLFQSYSKVEAWSFMQKFIGFARVDIGSYNVSDLSSPDLQLFGLSRRNLRFRLFQKQRSNLSPSTDFAAFFTHYSFSYPFNDDQIIMLFMQRFLCEQFPDNQDIADSIDRRLNELLANIKSRLLNQYKGELQSFYGETYLQEISKIRLNLDTTNTYSGDTISIITSSKYEGEGLVNIIYSLVLQELEAYENKLFQEKLDPTFVLPLMEIKRHGISVLYTVACQYPERKQIVTYNAASESAFYDRLYHEFANQKPQASRFIKELALHFKGRIDVDTMVAACEITELGRK